jgi:hypothetical protein
MAQYFAACSIWAQFGKGAGLKSVEFGKVFLGGTAAVLGPRSFNAEVEHKHGSCTYGPVPGRRGAEKYWSPKTGSRPFFAKFN